MGFVHLEGGEGGEGVKGGGPGSPKGVGGHPGRDAKDYLNIWRVVGFQWCSRLTWLTRTCFATFHTFAGDTGKFLSCCILYLGGFACVTFSFLPHLLYPRPTPNNPPTPHISIRTAPILVKEARFSSEVKVKIECCTCPKMYCSHSNRACVCDVSK